MNTLLEIFAKAEQTLRKPKVIYPHPLGKITITIAKNPKNPQNYLYIYFEHNYIAKITRDNKLIFGLPPAHLDPEQRTTLANAIELLHKDPVNYCQLAGQRYSFCCFCGTQIVSAHSLAVGYGPICADNWGLPWGRRNN